MRLSGLVIIGVASVVALPPSVNARAASSCGTAYHAQLQQIDEAVVGRVRAALERAQQAEPGWRGKWFYWNPYKDAVRRKLRRLGRSSRVIVLGGRVCTNQVWGQGGRIRCLKWKPKPDNYMPPPLASRVIDDGAQPPSDDEFKHLSALSRFVLQRGRLPQLATDTTLDHSVRRTLDELLVYLRQSARPTLCAGALPMLAFYRRQVEPILIAATRAQTLARQTREAASGIANADRDVDSRPTIADLLKTVADRVIPPAALQTESRAELKTDYARFAKIHTLLPAEPARNAPPRTVEERRAVTALRRIETAFYAAHRHQKFADLARGFNTVIRSIKTAHARACSCGLPSETER